MLLLLILNKQNNDEKYRLPNFFITLIFYFFLIKNKNLNLS